jgi:transposase
MQAQRAESAICSVSSTTRCIGETLMEARTVNNLPPAASHDDDAVRCVLAIELSKKSWIVAVNTSLSGLAPKISLPPCDKERVQRVVQQNQTDQRPHLLICFAT